MAACGRGVVLSSSGSSGGTVQRLTGFTSRSPPARLVAVDWQERCRRLLAKRNTAARLDAALAAVAQSVDAAVDQFERRLDVSTCRASRACRIFNLDQGEAGAADWAQACQPVPAGLLAGRAGL